jgi:hypothetical protein
LVTLFNPYYYKDVAMHIKILITFLLLFSGNGLSKIPSSITERDSHCKEMLHKAAFGDISYKKKIEIYDDLLPIIAFGVNHTVQKKYIAGLKKLFTAREQDHASNNQLLEKLFARALTIKQLDTASSSLQAWLSTLTEENKDQAISTKNIIALYFPQAHGYLHAQKNDASITFQASPFSEALLELPPSILFTFDADKESPLKNENTYIINPLYIQENKKHFPINQKTPLKVTFKKNNHELQNIYDKDHIQVLFDDPSQAPQLHETWAKIELHSEEERHTLENNYFAQQIAAPHLGTSLEEQIKSIDNQTQLFTETIADSHKVRVMQKIETLVKTLESLSLAEKQQLRQLCARAIQKLPPSIEKKTCKKYIALINQHLEESSLQFNDIVQLTTDNQIKLCTKYNPESLTEPIAITTVATENLLDQGTELIQISSPIKKTGGIRYGDEIELIPLYGLNRGALTQFNTHEACARRQKECRGKMIAYLGCSSRSHQSPGNQKTIFTLLPSDDLMYLKKNGSFYTPSDPCRLFHPASKEYITYNPKSAPLQQYNFSKKGSLFTCIKPAPEIFNHLNTTLFQQAFSSYYNQKTISNKIAKLKKMIPLLNSQTSQDSQNRVWQITQELFAQKASCSPQELQTFNSILKKTIPSLTQISKKEKNDFLIHVTFYTKLQHAHEQHGALRLSAYQTLIPYLQYENIDKIYKKELLSSINNLYERKTTELQTIHKLVDVVNTETKRIFNEAAL